MKLISCEKLEKSMVELQFSIDAETFKSAVNTAFKREGKKYAIPGFRKGKAPKAMIEKMYGKDLFQYDAINDLFPENYEAAVKEAGIEVVGRPDPEVVSMSEDEGATLKVKVAVKPEVELGEYTGLTVNKDVKTVDEADVDAEIKRMQDRNGRLLTREGAAENGDTVDIDFEGFVDGVAFEGGKAEHYSLVLGSGSFIPGFEEQVAGIRPEEERDVHVTFPTQYVPELAGKDATFHVKAHRIVRRSLPQLTDAFAQEQGFEDVSHLRRSIMEQAILQKQQAASNAFAEALMQQVVAGMEVQLPDSMVESQLTGILQELQQHLESQGASLSDYLQAAGLTMEDLRDHARENAVAAARYELAMTEIARQEGITVTEEELEEGRRTLRKVQAMAQCRMEALAELADQVSQYAQDFVMTTGGSCEQLEYIAQPVQEAPTLPARSAS